MNLATIRGNPEILAVIVFGSAARGDVDNASDRDVLLLCSDAADPNIERIRDDVARQLSCNPTSINVYTESQFRAMLRKGSLFAWHLKLEGKTVFARLDALFRELAPYSAYSEDLSLYAHLLSDCKRSVSERGPNLFDLAQLFTIARNCCMLICHKLGVATFGRTSVYYTSKTLVEHDVGLSERDYEKLCLWKLSYERSLKVGIALPSRDEMAAILGEVGQLLALGSRICSES